VAAWNGTTYGRWTRQALGRLVDLVEVGLLGSCMTALTVALIPTPPASWIGFVVAALAAVGGLGATRALPTPGRTPAAFQSTADQDVLLLTFAAMYCFF
jgi:hypothetical protein